MKIRPQWARTMSALALALAGGWTVLVGIDAWRLDPLPSGRAEPTSLPEEAIPALPASAAQLAVLLETDPFHPERRRPDERFGEMPADNQSVNLAPKPPGAAVQLLGTVVLPQRRSLAMCRVGNERARLLRLGDTLSNMRLAEIGQGRAVFIDGQGERLDLRVLKGGT